MRIVSTLALRPRGEQMFLVFDTFAGGKHFTTAIVESLDGGKHVTELGQKVLDFAQAHHHAKQHQGVGDVHQVPVLAESVARRRVVDVLTVAADGSLVVLFGRTNGVCAALMKVLGLQTAGPRQ